MDSNLQEKKLELIQWLSTLEDPAMIREIMKLRENDSTDWWDAISEEERISIEKGIEDADDGRLTPHTEVMKKYEKWL